MGERDRHPGTRRGRPSERTLRRTQEEDETPERKEQELAEPEDEGGGDTWRGVGEWRAARGRETGATPGASGEEGYASFSGNTAEPAIVEHARTS